MSMKVEVRPCVFLDTSVQITRLLGAPQKCQQIENVITNHIQAYSTAYVYMEYQRTVIADFAHVQRVLQQTGNWGDTITGLATGDRLFRPRALVRANRILGETLNRAQLDVEKGLLFLQTYLDYRLHNLFWNHVTPVPDTIQCDLLVSGVVQQADYTYQVADSCRKESAACALPSFLSTQHVKLQTVAEYLSAHPRAIKDQLRVEHLLQAIQKDAKTALGQTSCWPLGDLIILLLVPSDCAVWSLDPDFVSLCRALELQIYHQPL